MEGMVFVFVGCLCLFLGLRVYNAEERCTVFNKRHITVKDVQKYNHFCGSLILGFGLVAECTLYFTFGTSGIASTLVTLFIIVEAIVLMVIYNKMEPKFLENGGNKPLKDRFKSNKK